MTKNTLTTRLVEYLRGHSLPASINSDGTITTISEYVDRDGVFHSERVSLEPKTAIVREFLGY